MIAFDDVLLRSILTEPVRTQPVRTQPILAPSYLNTEVEHFERWVRTNQNKLTSYWQQLGGGDDEAAYQEFVSIQWDRECIAEESEIERRYWAGRRADDAYEASID